MIAKLIKFINIVLIKFIKIVLIKLINKID